MPILVNNQVLEDQWIRDEAAVLRDTLRTDLPELDDLTFGIRLREVARENVIARMLLQQAVGGASMDEAISRMTEDVPKPSKQDIAAYYRKFPQFFQAPEMLRAAHIVKNVDEKTTGQEAEAAILAAQQELKAGANFSAVADRYSDCPGEGGNLGFFARGEMVPEFEQVVFALKPGEISGVFRSPFGFHIAKVFEKRPPGLQPLNEVRQDIEQAIWRDTKRRLVGDVIEGLRAKADIRKA